MEMKATVNCMCVTNIGCAHSLKHKRKINTNKSALHDAKSDKMLVTITKFKRSQNQLLKSLPMANFMPDILINIYPVILQ